MLHKWDQSPTDEQLRCIRRYIRQALHVRSGQTAEMLWRPADVPFEWLLDAILRMEDAGELRSFKVDGPFDREHTLKFELAEPYSVHRTKMTMPATPGSHLR